MGRLIGVIIGVLAVGGAWYLWRDVTKPLLGETVPDLGQEHVQDISGVKYNSNPPTSGKHFPVWAKKGLYDRIISDGYLIHSLEHGYIVVSYNCAQESPVSSYQFPISDVYAHMGEEEVEEATDSAGTSAVSSVPNGSPQADSASIPAPLHRMYKTAPFTPSDPPSVEIELPESFKSEECTKLVEELRPLLKVAQRVIIVPRPGMDAQVILIAWGRIYKQNPFDFEKSRQFIKDFHNRGPEKTMEK